MMGLMRAKGLLIIGLAFASMGMLGYGSFVRAEDDPCKPPDNPQPAPASYKTSEANNGFDANFEKDREAFEEIEQICRKNDADPEKAIKGGLGPVFNDSACANCHNNPITGSASQISEIRAGFLVKNLFAVRPQTVFVEPSGGSLIHQRATDARIQAHVPDSDSTAPNGLAVRTLRMATNILGDGFVEVLCDEDIISYQDQQSECTKGFALLVAAATGVGTDHQPMLVNRVGRFGWKCQEASLLNFAAGAYLNEMGITNLLNKDENLSNGRFVGFGSEFDPLKELEDENDASMANATHPFGEDVTKFTNFMRSTSAPPQAFPAIDLVSQDDVKKGEALFGTQQDHDGFFGTAKNKKGIGCAECHRPSFVTPAEKALIHVIDTTDPASDIVGDPNDPTNTKSRVPKALGGKIIFPYSDFMMHDIGTGDGITQTQHAQNPPSGIENLIPAKIEKRVKRGYRIIRIQRQQNEKIGMERTKSSTPGVKPVVRVLVEALPPEDAKLDQSLTNKIRTAPLWGLRARNQFLHDGSALTVDQAIRRHQGQSHESERMYEALSEQEQKQLLGFLNSLGYGKREDCDKSQGNDHE